MKSAFFVVLAVTVVLTVSGQGPASDTLEVPPLPDFIYTVRGAYGYEDFQSRTMKDLGLEYVQGLVDFSWINIERHVDGSVIWKWGATDEGMEKLAQVGLKVIPCFITPKLEGLHWDPTIKRDDPRYAKAYGEFAYQVVKRYYTHPAWSGLVCVWGGSSDVFGKHPFHEPEVQVPLLNAVYDGVKRADPNTIVASFNMGTGYSREAWEGWHTRAFALSPKFDRFGVHSPSLSATYLDSLAPYGGVLGLTNVRRFLDEHGYADKPIWQNEGGVMFGDDIGGLPEDVHAEQVVEIYIVSRTLDVNLRGWVYFVYFAPCHECDDFGLMNPAREPDDPPPQPRKAWHALQTLIKAVKFFDYQFDAKLSGEYNQPSPPFVYRFTYRDRPSSKLWVVFSPRIPKQKPIIQNVIINIAPARQAILIDMLGGQATVTADASGNITVASTSSPVYLKVGD